MKFIRITKPQVPLSRYVENFAAKYDCIRLSSLKGCGFIGHILHIFARGKTAWVLPLPKIFVRFPMAFRNGSLYDFCNWLNNIK